MLSLGLNSTRSKSEGILKSALCAILTTAVKTMPKRKQEGSELDSYVSNIADVERLLVLISAMYELTSNNTYLLPSKEYHSKLEYYKDTIQRKFRYC
jgi:hypothetical protein